MNRPILELRFYETYYFANAVQNILKDQFSFIRHLNDFYGDDKHFHFTKPFQRFSAFHCFLEFVIDVLLCEPTEQVDLSERLQTIERFKDIPSAIASQNPMTLPIEAAFRFHGYKYESFCEWLSENDTIFEDATSDHIYDYLNELRLSGPYDDLLLHSVREVFYLLFRDRQVLLLFNDMIARQVSKSSISEIPTEFTPYFSRSGILKRTHIPEWVRRAIFFRDRGMCVACRIDLSGILNIWSEDHFDHIVPLASGGLNDVTNIQLLCAACNLKKGGDKIFTSNSYEDWYPFP
ncbi:HNH endonuclease [Undibacterium sp. TC4M20W]|uniref:HNH endonuclease n=1 Tax=Undibacterium sp. TC4M20W TaxID=3413052 RepID=UPI003BF2AEAA